MRACTATTVEGIKECMRLALGRNGISRSAIRQNIVFGADRVRAGWPKHDGVKYGSVNAERILADVILGHDVGYPWHWRGNEDGTESASFSGESNREALARTWAHREAILQSEMEKLAGEGFAALPIVAGTSPAKDAQGNDMPETTPEEQLAAWVVRRDLYNSTLCHFWGKQAPADELNRRIGAMTSHAISSKLSEAKQQLRSKFDRAMTARLRYLFDGETRSHNSDQRDAHDAMLRHRQILNRALAAATTKTASETAATAAIAALAAVTVAHVPDWLDSTGEPKGKTCPVTYTKGTGSRKWKLDLDVQNAGRVTTEDGVRTRDDTYGPIAIEPFTHPEFELVTRTTAHPIVNDVTLRLQRKTGATGHPAAGTYSLELVARNFRGPSVLTVNVTVPA